LNCFARTFVYGLRVGRNCTKILEQFLTPEEVIGIQKKFLIINREDEVEEVNMKFEGYMK
jgi:hypothetical protein